MHVDPNAPFPPYTNILPAAIADCVLFDAENASDPRQVTTAVPSATVVWTNEINKRRRRALHDDRRTSTAE